jgi:dTDP-4-dehydrorhamnose 3,5-epimerase
MSVIINTTRDYTSDITGRDQELMDRVSDVIRKNMVGFIGEPATDASKTRILKMMTDIIHERFPKNDWDKITIDYKMDIDPRNVLLNVTKWQYNIHGVVSKELGPIHDERGYLMEILRDEDVPVFGQVYVSAIYDGAIKAWHQHKDQTDRICCISGMIKLVLLQEHRDYRPGLADEPSMIYEPGDSPPRAYRDNNKVVELFIGEDNPCVVTIPPGVWHGWKAYKGDAIVMNVTDIPYNREDPDENRRRPEYFDDWYKWERVNK